MIRETTLEEISDGKLYESNDLVKAETNNCSGCRALCCKNMDKSIVLDPRDIFELTIGRFFDENKEQIGETISFNDLVDSKKIALNIVDGVILPNITMDNETKSCQFLDEFDRCSVHKNRPGICRMFPLGRAWMGPDNFKYILQTNQCHKEGLTKVKVKKWLGISELEEYEKFSCLWHKYLTDVRTNLSGLDDNSRHIFNMYNLKTFYTTSYKAKNLTGFYREFSMRLKKAYKELNLVDI